LKDLPSDIAPTGSPEPLRTLAAWYREYAAQTNRRELAVRRLDVAEALEELAAHGENLRRSPKTATCCSGLR